MLSRPKWGLSLCTLLLVTLDANWLAIAQDAQRQKIKGSIKNDIYTNPGKEYEVHIPVRVGAGRAIREEQAKRPDVEISQVIFTDDFGSFYRIVSITPSNKDDLNIDKVLNVFHDIRDKQTVETSRGRELRVIDVEKQGSEMTMTTMDKTGASMQRPDLVTANAIFVANGRIYHLTAGSPLLEERKFGDVTIGRKIEDVIKSVREDLEQFLAGFKPLEIKKK